MQTIFLHIYQKKDIPVLFAKQKDVGRKFKAVISDGTDNFHIPEDAVLSVWYSGTSGEGNYSSIGQGKSAFSVEGNEVIVELIAQMLVNKGGGMLSLVMHSADGMQIGLWNIPYLVEELPGAESEEAQQYYNAFSENVSQVMDAVRRAEELESAFVVDTTLSVSGRGADAAAVGAALALKAPAGYGLGTGCVSVVNANDIRSNCHFYFYPGIGSISGASSGIQDDLWFGEHVEHSLYNRAYQRITYGNGVYRGCYVSRTREAQTWGEWEWENPPMIPGVEYRTTERWNGRSVYAMLVVYGTLPNNGSKDVGIDVSSGSALIEVIDIGGIFTNGEGVSGALLGLGSIASSWATCTRTRIALGFTTNDDASEYDAYPLIKYIKD